MPARHNHKPPKGRSRKHVPGKQTRSSGILKRGAIGRSKLPSYGRKRQQRKLSVTSTDTSDEETQANGGAALEDDDDDDPDDESDVSAPSHSSRVNREAGPPTIQDEDVKEPMMFDTDEEHAAWFGDSENDDDIYEGVDEISDDEEDADPAAHEEYLAAQFFDHPDVAANFLGEIDGFSIFGFEDDIDRNSFSSSSESSDDAVVQRRVHFETSVEEFPPVPTSPQLQPMLSAAMAIPHKPAFSQEEIQQSSRVEELSAAHRAFLGDPDEDSDLTDEELPAEAHTNLSALEQKPADTEVFNVDSSPTGKRSKKGPARRRGPTLGVFEFDGDKPWAVLDPSGTKVHIAPPPDTNRHDWLERSPQHNLNQILGIGSADSSPRTSVAALLDDSDGSVTSSQENAIALVNGAGANVLMASLNGGDGSANPYGHATGPPEAFYAPSGSQVVGDYLIDTDEFDLDEDDWNDPTGEGRLNIEDFIVCDGDSDAENNLFDPVEPSATPAIFTPTHKKSDSWSHLNSDNVMSFRRNLEPLSEVKKPPAWNFELPPKKTPTAYFPPSPINRKRKARSPPYRSDHYKDVTVIERKLITPRAKRRRANTMH